MFGGPTADSRVARTRLCLEMWSCTSSETLPAECVAKQHGVEQQEWGLSGPCDWEAGGLWAGAAVQGGAERPARWGRQKEAVGAGLAWRRRRWGTGPAALTSLALPPAPSGPPTRHGLGVGHSLLLRGRVGPAFCRAVLPPGDGAQPAIVATEWGGGRRLCPASPWLSGRPWAVLSVWPWAVGCMMHDRLPLQEL